MIDNHNDAILWLRYSLSDHLFVKLPNWLALKDMFHVLFFRLCFLNKYPSSKAWKMCVGFYLVELVVQNQNLTDAYSKNY